MRVGVRCVSRWDTAWAFHVRCSGLASLCRVRGGAQVAQPWPTSLGCLRLVAGSGLCSGMRVFTGVVAAVAAAAFAVTAGAAVASYSYPHVSNARIYGDSKLASGALIVVDSSDAAVCSLGVPWVLSEPSASAGWASAGHCFDGVDDVYSWRGERIGVGADVGLAAVDAAFLRADDSSQVAPAVLGSDRPELPVRDVASVAVGDEVCVVGSTSGVSCGWRVGSVSGSVNISGRDVDAAQAFGRAESCVSAGDSSGPVVMRLPSGDLAWAGVVAASSVSVGFEPVVAQVCSVAFTTIDQLQDALGGQAITAGS